MKIEITLNDRRAAKAPSVVTTKEMDRLYKLLVEMAEQDTDWRLEMSANTAKVGAAVVALGDKVHALVARVADLQAKYDELASVHEDPAETASLIDDMNSIAAVVDAVLPEPAAVFAASVVLDPAPVPVAPPADPVVPVAA